ncbi:MAG: hypothetical protein ACO3SP_06570 [Ilumatobacteraceae bacterium]
MLVALGVWGLVADRSEPAGVGDSVGLGGGSVRVDDAWVLGDPMAGMHSSANQFASLGMSMSQMLPDAVPEGMKRVAIQMHLAAGSTREMEFPARDFALVVDGVRYGTYRSLLGDQRLSPGDQLLGMVVFEVPMEALSGTLESPRFDRMFQLDFGPGGEHGHNK